MSLMFTPPADVARFALSIGSFFRTYDTVARAKIAFHNHRWSAQYGSSAYILELVDGRWFKLYTIEDARNVDSANLPWYKDKGHRWGWNSGRRVSTPMTSEEYAEWRIQVDHELIALKPIEQIIALFESVNA